MERSDQFSYPGSPTPAALTRQRRDAAATTVSKTESQPVRPMARRYTELFPKDAGGPAAARIGYAFGADVQN